MELWNGLSRVQLRDHLKYGIPKECSLSFQRQYASKPQSLHGTGSQVGKMQGSRIQGMEAGVALITINSSNCLGELVLADLFTLGSAGFQGLGLRDKMLLSGDTSRNNG